MNATGTLILKQPRSNAVLVKIRSGVKMGRQGLKRLEWRRKGERVARFGKMRPEAIRVGKERAWHDTIGSDEVRNESG
jgi:hypothetical protein